MKVPDRPRAGRFADGLVELMLGIFMLIAAMALELVGEPLISGLVAMAGIFAAAKFFERLQAQLSESRAGSQRPGQGGKSRLWDFVAAVLVVVAVLSMSFWFLDTRLNSLAAWLGLMVGAAVGLALLAWGLRLRLWRAVVQGVVSILLGGLLSPLVLGPGPSSGPTGVGLMSVYFFGMGISLSLGGWIGLNRFVKSRPGERKAGDG
ncbi:MAG: hypothetical protein AB1846_00905 [Chloroflexota bacterium]